MVSRPKASVSSKWSVGGVAVAVACLRVGYSRDSRHQLVTDNGKNKTISNSSTGQ